MLTEIREMGFCEYVSKKSKGEGSTGWTTAYLWQFRFKSDCRRAKDPIAIENSLEIFVLWNLSSLLKTWWILGDVSLVGENIFSCHSWLWHPTPPEDWGEYLQEGRSRKLIELEISLLKKIGLLAFSVKWSTLDIFDVVNQYFELEQSNFPSLLFQNECTLKTQKILDSKLRFM